MTIATRFPAILSFPVEVALSEAEWAIAHYLGRTRRRTNRGNSIVDRQIGVADPLRVDVLGAVAELAFSRVSGVAPDLDTASRKGSVDAVLPSGRTVDVKATEHRDRDGRLDGRLIVPAYKVRLEDLADIIVLARVDMGGDPSVAPEHTDHPPLVTLVGFTYAPEVVNDRRLVNLRKPTYVLPNEDLLTDLGILDQCDDR
jgi:hypothetical protein